MRAPALWLVALLCALLSLSPSLVAAHDEPTAAPFRPSSPPLAALWDDGPSCTLCQAIVTRALDMTQNSTERAEFANVLNTQVCAPMGGLNALLCYGVVGELVKLLPSVPAKLFDAGFYTPQILCSFLGQCSVPCCIDSGNRPSQVHLAVGAPLGGGASAMTVTWVTADGEADTLVRYGPSETQLMYMTKAESHTTTEGGWVGSIHVASLTELRGHNRTYYQVGGDSTGWSDIFSFAPLAATVPTPYSLIFVGDLGSERNYSAGNQDFIVWASSPSRGGRVLPGGKVDGVVHIGDISYADGYMERWDELFTALEPAASQGIYMTCPGNHEIYFDFAAYDARMQMPPPLPAPAPSDATSAPRYYSWDAGCVHFVSISSENRWNQPQIEAEQVQWLRSDLEAFAMRRKWGRERERDQGVPTTCSYDAPTFLVVYMHRPMYCSASGNEMSKRCGPQASYLRDQVEALFMQYEVDVVFSGHVHAYERTSGVFNGTTHAQGPKYIMNGSGGNREGEMNNWEQNPPAWSQSRFGMHGLGSLSVLNRTALHWQWWDQTELAHAVEHDLLPKPLDEAIFHRR